MINEKLKVIFEKEKIEYVNGVPYELLPQNPNCKKIIDFKPESVIMLAVPYFCDASAGNVSLYARARDYHKYFSQLSERILPQIKDAFGCRAVLFSDTSPIMEVESAALAGLGVVGKHGLLITKKYSSFVFLAGIFTDIPVCNITDKTEFSVEYCENCNICKRACPCENGECLSNITQTKGELAPHEIQLMQKYNTAWGCDICQLSCPHTKRMLESKVVTPIEFFKNDLIRNIDESTVNMEKCDFLQRAFSWRGRTVLKRNLTVCKKN